MSLDPGHLEYPMRRYGMDHERYDWSMLAQRTPVQWPDGNVLALWVNVSLQHFPLDQRSVPFAPPGGMSMPYPDLRHYSLRDYGNRIGVYRVLRALDRFGLRASFAINAQLADIAPALLQRIAARDDEVIAHGWNMDALHYGGMDSATERELVARSVDRLRDATGQPVRGWLSPARNESEHTPELIAAHGIDYLCDWVNDDLPYPFRTAEGELTALPLSTELEDRFVIANNLHSEASWAEQVSDACDLLLDEARRQGGRLLALSVHPWLLGQPHRIGYFEAVLDNLSHRPGIWNAAPGAIVDCWRAQQQA